ncbi:MAG: glucose 1-dehydrogenase [Acidimicrobiia bacterium]|nr:glucose 1-dehydrogenase [Acidimicrobiia bacterium]
MGRLDGKVAVITGAASGIGAATARLFVEEGARVVLGDIQDEVGERVAGELGERARFRHCNVAREDQVAALVAEATGAWGRLDVLYNNAGFVGASGRFEDTSVDEYDLTMDVLLKSVFLGIKSASPIMAEQRSGSIISTASVCGLVPAIGTHLYNVAKAGVVMMTKTAALELAEHDVRVNCICPGYIATQLAAGRELSQVDDEENAARMAKVRERMGSSQPIQRMGEPPDIARMALFLASDDSAWVTGTAQVVDGGLTLGKPWRKLNQAITEPGPIRMYRPAD